MKFCILLILSLVIGCSAESPKTAEVSKEIKTLSSNEVLELDSELKSKLLKIKEFNKEASLQFSRHQFLTLSSKHLAKDLALSYAKDKVKFYSNIDKLNLKAASEIASIFRVKIIVNNSRLVNCLLEVDSYDSSRPLNDITLKLDLYKCLNDAFLISEMTLSDISPSESYKKISSSGEYAELLSIAKPYTKTTISELIKKHKEFK